MTLSCFHSTLRYLNKSDASGPAGIHFFLPWVIFCVCLSLHFSAPSCLCVVERVQQLCMCMCVHIWVCWLPQTIDDLNLQKYRPPSFIFIWTQPVLLGGIFIHISTTHRAELCCRATEKKDNSHTVCHHREVICHQRSSGCDHELYVQSLWACLCCWAAMSYMGAAAEKLPAPTSPSTALAGFFGSTSSPPPFLWLLPAPPEVPCLIPKL